ncbi:zinc finger protein 518A [Betta splendens]|uniref:Zinc finger protein 518A n=1 Tax=Betta splendens TaxID=158456 RepID=A0A6P7L8E7_BETSP|nr:zinc finger protein 518A [Betta splendens]
MEEDLTIPHDSVKNGSISVIEDEKDKVKDFVYKHIREGPDGSLFNNPEEATIKEYGSPTKKDKPSILYYKAPCKSQQGAVFSGKILSFGCSVCKDTSTYSPNDLLKHFQVAHKGTLPTYPCELCGFAANEFSALQRHRIEHRNTLVKCELCNDDVQYSLLLLTRHYIMSHSLNGQFNCDWCDFTTVDAGTFVQHIHHHNESPWKCSKCRHISLNDEDHQKHLKGHSGTFPFTCQICGYGAARTEYLKKHSAAVHKEETERRRISKLNCLSGSLPNQNGRLIKPDLSLDETPHLVDGNVVKKFNKARIRSSHNTEQSASVMLQECDNGASGDAGSHTNPNGLTVLMVKNKISLPPNCTTKVMGFKMVDGKKHLVLKVIPAGKQDSSTQNHSSIEELGLLASKALLEKSKVSVENGECSDSRSSSSHCFAVSPRSAACIQLDQDEIMAVKVKLEEEETAVCDLDSPPHREDIGEQTDGSLTCSDMSFPVTDEFDHISDQSPPSQTSSERSVFDNNSDGSKASYVSSLGKVTGSSKTLNVVQETSLSRSAAENCEAEDEFLTDRVADKNDNKRNFPFGTRGNKDQSSQSTPEKPNRDGTDIEPKNSKLTFEKLLKSATPLSESSVPTLDSHKETAMGSENCIHNSPNQEVFSFHNYSKENFSTSPNTTQNYDNMSEHSPDNKSICDSSNFNLTLAESPELFTESVNEDSTQENNQESIRKVSATEIEVDECVASVHDSANEDENSESVFQDFNIIKVEEENIPISKNPPDARSNSAGLGSFVSEHSDAIVNQQLNKERKESVCGSSDSLKQTKTTTKLRILQLPDGKQPVLLRTAENRFTMPLQVKSTPGFKLITSSSNPQINVSYMKPGIEKLCNLKGAGLSPSNLRLGVSVPKAGPTEKKGTTLLSTVQPSVSSTSNHYLINRPGFKGPVLLSSTPHSANADKTAKTQSTCYLVQRSVPLVQNPSNPAVKLAGAQLPVNSRPVLAMPVSSADKPGPLQPGRQAFLLRYITPPKSGLLLNKSGKPVTQCSQIGENTANKVIFKIVTPTSSLLTSSASTSNSHPLFLATRPQTQCFLVSSNKTNANATSGIKKLITIQNTAQKDVTDSNISPAQMNVKVTAGEAEKPALAPRPIRPPSQRKRRRKQLFDELPSTIHKARRLSNKALTEKETPVLWKPTAKEVERTLRLSPFASSQQIKYPRRYQPVVVLNHPDADIPEVANIMKVVNRNKGAVTKVSLSQKTIQALSELDALEKNSSTKCSPSHSSDIRPRPVQSSVRERFLLTLKLRKKSRKKYEVVDTLPGCGQDSVVFDCWFCGRLFKSQEDWIGHGQRHLMEATRDWNKLF